MTQVLPSLFDAVKEIDEIFIKGTIKLSKPIFGVESVEWWYKRIPENHTTDFREDIEDYL